MEWADTSLIVAAVLIILVSYWNTTARLGRIERKLNALMRHAGIDPAQGLPLSEHVKDLARDPGRKIQAIKAYREETGVGLKEAKDAVETFINSQ
jgi:ribosomal protein L7/L12